LRAHPRLRPYRRHRGISLGLTALLALLVVGMPATALAQEATESPVPSPVASEAPAPSEAPAASPAGDSGPAFPTTLAGADLEVLTYTGHKWIAEFKDGTGANEDFAADTVAMLESLGKDLDDLTVRSALVEPTPGNQAVILALQVDGAESRDFVAEAVRLLLGDVAEPEFALRPLGGRWVLRVVDAAIPGVYPRTVYLNGDTAWIIGADEAHVLELLEQLPEQSYDDGSGAAALAARLPLVLDGRRRTGLYEAREPLFLPALERRLGPALDAWLLDAYLKAFVTPTDLVGAIAWWGIDSSDESVEVEGYQVPGGRAELIESLRSEVLLASGEPLPDEVSRTEQELGGRQVTSIDLGGSIQHVFASGDTVWVVTDHAGEGAMAEEAIAALP
jgi:hypothetical protein